MNNTEREAMKPSPLDFDPFEGDFGDFGDRTLSDAMVKGRKPHVCWHCAGPVAVGETHRSRCDIADGSLMRFRWCALCCAAMLAQMADSGDENADPYPYESRANLNKEPNEQH